SVEIKEINEIVQAIIIQDSLNVLKNITDSRMFCSELKKIEIEIPIKRKDGLIFPPNLGNRDINEIVNIKIENKLFFSKQDSLYIMEQSLKPQKFKIDKTITNKLNATTFENEMKKRKSGKQYDFYEMKIPIFSLDRQKVYIELDHRCGSLCGSGRAISLKKINGKWKIIEKWRTWIS
ncbi:hypothetical protein, partial [Flavobacterium psychrophilum]